MWLAWHVFDSGEKLQHAIIDKKAFLCVRDISHSWANIWQSALSPF
jgi:hypothetical protein